MIKPNQLNLTLFVITTPRNKLLSWRLNLAKDEYFYDKTFSGENLE
ncbi:hypothetical protein B6N60_02464 [Richelia sinica FACHB-800]|uniref:Uncharacterized protein n=1 Tax=Richelia sinica FACHB-800 TaxID=1357546 RepID=A0A975Y524_9NOST|nr:hypothetical protein B6N60_02464 [Richelia sinica FACHB-800]